MRPVRRVRVRLAALIVLAAFGAQALVSCTALPEWLPGMRSTPTPIPDLTPTPTQAPVVDISPTPVSTLELSRELTIWLPPEFDPEGEGKASALLKQRLNEFSEANDVKIHVRLKAPAGPGGLVESLISSSAAAPMALPSLAALSRSDLESAALKGLLIPLEGTSTALQGDDWYDYARQLSRVQDTSFGLPFAGDALLVVYRPSMVTPSPASWEGILNIKQPFGFPVANQQALATIALYQSAGGEVVDAQGRPMVDTQRLSQVLALYQQAAQNGVFPTWLSQYDSEAQVWQAYEKGLINSALTWSSLFLANLPADTSALPMPSPSGGSLGLATGWNWVVTDPLPERRELTTHLAEWLVDPAFLGAWTEAAGYLPTRPSALMVWQDGSLKAVLSQVALSTRARPSNDILFILGPVVRDAVLSVIRMESDPVTAASTASQRISSPPPP